MTYKYQKITLLSGIFIFLFTTLTMYSSPASAAAKSTSLQGTLYSDEIIPAPQKVFSKFVTLNFSPENIQIITSKKTEKCIPLAKKMLKRKIAECISSKKIKSKKLNIYLGQANESLIRKFKLKKMPRKPQGYVIEIFDSPKQMNIVAAGFDNRGCFYAAMTLLQMMRVENNSIAFRTADVYDYPVWQRRFASNYGPFIKENILTALRFKLSGLTLQLRHEWREFKPEAKPRYGHFKNYADALKVIKDFAPYDVMDFMVIIHIYASKAPRKYPIFSVANEQHIKELAARCEFVAQKGVNYIMIAADDWTPMKNGQYVCPGKGENSKFKRSIGRAHGYLIKRLDSILKKKYPQLKLMFVPPVYSLHRHKAASPAMAAYLKDLTDNMPKESLVAWTGPQIISPKINHSDVIEFSRLLKGRKTFIWDNSDIRFYPVHRWATDFYSGMNQDVNGIFINGQSFAGVWRTIFMVNANDYLWNPKGFDKNLSHKKAFEKFSKIEYSIVKSFSNNFALAKQEQNNKKAKQYLQKVQSAFSHMKENGMDDWWTRRYVNSLATGINSNVPEVTVQYLPGRPKLDGIINEKFWDKAKTFKLSSRYGKLTAPGETAFGRICYNSEGLYMAFELRHMKKLKPNSSAKIRSHDVFLASDLIEIFLRPNKSSRYAQFVFDCDGNRFNLQSKPRPLKWSPKWRAAVKHEKNKWSAEVMIPFSDLKDLMTSPPASGTQWRANFCRQSTVNSTKQQCWSPTFSNNFHATRLFGRLTFQEK